MKGKPAIEIAGDALAFAYNVAGAAAGMKGPFPNPENMKFGIVDDVGEVTNYSFTDNPENRAMAAVKEHLKGASSEEFMSTMLRVFALNAIFHDERLKEWVRPSVMKPNHFDVSEAVFETAGRMPLGQLDRGFNVNRFVRRVRVLAQEMEAKANATSSEPG